jgi:hypothetical protein
MNMIVPLAQRDILLIQIEKEIQNKRTLLLQKRKGLDKKEKVNKYLEDVKQDYMKYENYIVQQKQKEYRAMNMIKDYIGDLVKTEKLLDSQMRTAKHHQKDILHEIDNIKGELDNLIET